MYQQVSGVPPPACATGQATHKGNERTEEPPHVKKIRRAVSTRDGARQFSGVSPAGARTARGTHPSQRVYVTLWMQSAHSTLIPVSVSHATPWTERVVGAVHHGCYLTFASACPAREALKDI